MAKREGDKYRERDGGNITTRIPEHVSFRQRRHRFRPPGVLNKGKCASYLVSVIGREGQNFADGYVGKLENPHS